MSSSIALVTSTTSPPDEPRILNLTFSLINETFHGDLNNASSAKFVNLSGRVNFTVLVFIVAVYFSLASLRDRRSKNKESGNLGARISPSTSSFNVSHAGLLCFDKRLQGFSGSGSSKDG